MSSPPTVIVQILMVILMATASLAQTKVLSSRVFLSKRSALPGQEIGVALQLDIEKGWHINAHEPLGTSLVPTEVVVETDPQFKLQRIRYPEPKRKAFQFMEGELAIYEGKVHIFMDLAVTAEASRGKGRISGKVTYQACNDRSCLLPAEVTFSAWIPITTEPTEAYPTHPEIFQSSKRTILPPNHPSAAITVESGWLLSLLVIFLGGLALNLTPCIYPLVPITVGFFIAQGAGRPRWVFVLSLFYVLGMAITYSVLGTLAALTGNLFGSALQNPLVLLFIAFVLVGLSFSMFGLYEIRIPAFLARIAGKSSQGVLGALLMGLTVGILAAPCIGPLVIGLLSYVGQRGNPLLGFWAFFILALGLGTPFIFLGTLSGNLGRLPRSGEWMVWVRRVFGFILLGMALYFLRNLISHELYWLTQASIAAVGSIYLGWVEGSGKGVKGFQRVKWGTGVLGLLFSSYLLLAPGHLLFHRPGIQWSDYHEELLQRAKSEAKPVIIHFTAGWCIPCREMEHRTFSSPPAIAKARRFVTLRVDLTHSTTPRARGLMERYRVTGVPTVIFLDRDGREIEELRFYEVIRPQEFLQRMQEALEAHEDPLFKIRGDQISLLSKE